MDGSPYFQQPVAIFKGGCLGGCIQARGTGDGGWEIGAKLAELRVVAHQLAFVLPGEQQDCPAVSAGHRPRVGFSISSVLALTAVALVSDRRPSRVSTLFLKAYSVTERL